MLAVIDGITRDSLEIRVDRKLNPTDVIDRLANLLTLPGARAWLLR